MAATQDQAALQVLKQLEKDLGGRQKLNELLQRESGDREFTLVRKQVTGLCSLEVSDWDGLKQFLLEMNPSNREVQNYAALCAKIREDIDAQDDSALIEDLLAAYRIMMHR